MKTLKLALCAVGLVLMAGQLPAIDGGALMVDTLSIGSGSFDHSGAIVGALENETAVRTIGEDWSILLGVGYSSVDTDWAREDYTAISGRLGVKYYITKYLGVGIVGIYDEYDALGASDVVTTLITLKHRFAAARVGVSPYMNCAAGVRVAGVDVGSPEDEESSTDGCFSLGLGCDFMITDQLAIVFEGYYSSVLADDTNDGLFGRIGLMSYWD